MAGDAALLRALGYIELRANFRACHRQTSRVIALGLRTEPWPRRISLASFEFSRFGVRKKAHPLTPRPARDHLLLIRILRTQYRAVACLRVHDEEFETFALLKRMLREAL